MTPDNPQNLPQAAKKNQTMPQTIQPAQARPQNGAPVHPIHPLPQNQKESGNSVATVLGVAGAMVGGTAVGSAATYAYDQYNTPDIDIEDDVDVEEVITSEELGDIINSAAPTYEENVTPVVDEHVEVREIHHHYHTDVTEIEMDDIPTEDTFDDGVRDTWEDIDDSPYGDTAYGDGSISEDSSSDYMNNADVDAFLA